MDVSTATAASHGLTARGWLVLVALVVALVVGYLIQCAIWPFANCLACHGKGRKYQNERRKTWRDCWWCKGAGRRLRIGRRIWAYFKQTKAKGTK